MNILYILVYGCEKYDDNIHMIPRITAYIAKNMAKCIAMNMAISPFNRTYKALPVNVITQRFPPRQTVSGVACSWGAVL